MKTNQITVKHLIYGILFGCFILIVMMLFHPITAKAETYFLGDSRTVGMRIMVHDQSDVTFAAEISANYNWMKTAGYPMIKNQIQSGDTIVVTMGVNDVADSDYADYYIEFLKELAENHPECKIYYISVNPVQMAEESTITNQQIDDWNIYIKTHLPAKVKYLDTNNNISFGFWDWLHYDNDTNLAVFEYIMNAIQPKPAEANTAATIGTETDINTDLLFEISSPLRNDTATVAGRLRQVTTNNGAPQVPQTRIRKLTRQQKIEKSRLFNTMFTILEEH